MPTLQAPPPPGYRQLRRSLDARAVLGELDRLHSTMEVGAKFPSERELARTLDASERAIAWALAELARDGKITKGVGRSGSVVADPGERQSVGAAGMVPSSTVVGSRTVVAIAKPDRGVFDHAIHLLSGRVTQLHLELTCDFITPNVDINRYRVAAHVQPLGYVVFRSDLLAVAQMLHAAGRRVVLVGNPPEGLPVGVPNVYGNHEQGGYRAAKHLLDLGHRHLAFVSAPTELAGMRWRGFERAVDEVKSRGEAVQISTDLGRQWERWRIHPAMAKEYFARPDSATGLVMWNDAQSLELLSFLQFIGVRVPEDVSLVGYDNLPASQNVYPSLTTVDTALEQLLEAALDVITHPERQAALPTIITLPTLIVRKSSAPPRAA